VTLRTELFPVSGDHPWRTGRGDPARLRRAPRNQGGGRRTYSTSRRFLGTMTWHGRCCGTRSGTSRRRWAVHDQLPPSRVAELAAEEDLWRLDYFLLFKRRHTLLVRFADHDGLHGAALDPTNWSYAIGDGDATFGIRQWMGGTGESGGKHRECGRRDTGVALRQRPCRPSALLSVACISRGER